MARNLHPLTLGLRLRLMLTLTAVAIFPIACVSYVVVRSEVGNVTRGADFELREAALAAQSRFAELLDRRALTAVAAASPVQTAVRRRSRATLERFARRHGLLLEVGRHTYGRPIPGAARARVQLTSRGRAVGWIVAQVPLDAATLEQVGTARGNGVRLSFVGLHARNARGVTLRLTDRAAVRAYLAPGVADGRTAAAYHRVELAGALGLLALMLLTLLLARPLLRALSWTEARASEARVDALTGVANRRALEESLAAEISRAQRFRHPLAVVLLDLDHFKQANDSYGHAGGDLLLCTVSRIVSSIARQGDIVARFGGEEFVVVLPETDLGGARRFAERLRRAIQASPVDEMRTTASFGVATLVADDSVDRLLNAADRALYLAKANGRNRVEGPARDNGGPTAPTGASDTYIRPA